MYVDGSVGWGNREAGDEKARQREWIPGVAEEVRTQRRFLETCEVYEVSRAETRSLCGAVTLCLMLETAAKQSPAASLGGQRLDPASLLGIPVMPSRLHVQQLITKSDTFPHQLVLNRNIIKPS